MWWRDRRRPDAQRTGHPVRGVRQPGHQNIAKCSPDITGHYARPDIFQSHVNTQPPYFYYKNMPPNSNIKLCPKCNSTLQRCHRNFYDKIISIFIIVKRYKCYNYKCQFSILKAPENQSINAFIEHLSRNRLSLVIFKSIPIILLYFVLKILLLVLLYISLLSGLKQ